MNWALIVINVVVFLFTVLALEDIVASFGFTPAYFSWLTVFTSMFLHGGFGASGVCVVLPPSGLFELVSSIPSIEPMQPATRTTNPSNKRMGH